MTLINQVLSRSHHGYTSLRKSTSSLGASRTRRIVHFLGHYFSQMTTYSPFLLLPTVLIYMSYDDIPAVVLVPFISAFFLGVLYQAQDLLLYHPSMPPCSKIYVPSPPSEAPYEEVHLKTDDNIKLYGFFLKQPEEVMKSAPTLICFHGNAGNAGLPSIYPLYFSCQVNVLTIDYRGYGRSTGTPSESGLYIDGETAVRYLHDREDIDHSKVILFGHSLGGAVSIHLAAKSQWVKRHIAGVIVENTFTNIPDTAVSLVKAVGPVFQFLPKFCYKNLFDSVNKVKDITVPMLFIFGDKDKIVAPDMCRTLYKTAHNPRSAIVKIPNGTHNDTWCMSPNYIIHIAKFLDKVFHRTSHGWQSPQSSEELTSLSWEWQQEIANC